MSQAPRTSGNSRSSSALLYGAAAWTSRRANHAGDRALIAIRHDKFRDFAEGEKARLLVLVTHERRVSAQYMTAVGNDHDINALADVVLPAIQQRSSRDFPACLLAYLPHHAASGVLAQLKFPARQRW